MTIIEIIQAFVTNYDKVTDIGACNIKNSTEKEIEALLFPDSVETAFVEGNRVLTSGEISCKTCKHNLGDNACALCGLRGSKQPVRWERP